MHFIKVCSNLYIILRKQIIYTILHMSILTRAVKQKHRWITLRTVHLRKVFCYNGLVKTLSACFSADGKRCLFAFWNSFCLYAEKWRVRVWRFWLVLLGLFKMDSIVIAIKIIQEAQLSTLSLTSSTFALKLFQYWTFVEKIEI